MPTPQAPQSQTVIRGVEAFLVVLVTAFVSQITVGGQPIDLSTPAGRVTVSTALVSALVLALRRAIASSQDQGGVG